MGRRDVLGLKPDPGLKRLRDIFEIPTIFPMSKAVVSPPVDWPCSSKITGWFFLDNPDYEPPADLVDFIAMGAPPVCVNFGSMVLVERSNLISTVVHAACSAGKRVLLITGWATPPNDLP